MRVSAFAPYPALGPSTRYRLVQLAGPLAERGVDLDVLPFVEAGRYGALRDGGAAARARVLVRGLLRRRAQTGPAPGGRAPAAEVALVHRELAPVLNRPLLRRVRGSGAPVVFDFDDAVYLPPPGGARLLRPLRDPGADARAFCRAAAAVMAGNAHLAEWAREARGGGEGVHVVPTVVDTERFRPRGQEGAPSLPPRVGWVGSRSSLPYLEALDVPLRRAMERRPFELVVVADRPPCLATEHTFVPWTPDGEAEHVRALDVGLYPLPDDPWTRGKCGFKAIQYMACGLPVVASPVGVLRDLVVPGETGLLAGEAEDWEEALVRLVDDAAARREMGRRGRERIVRSWSVQAWIDEVAGILKAAGGRA